MANVREPAVAGMFYPADADELRRVVEEMLSAFPDDAPPVPKAIIAPHAGYPYSGPVAASVYARLRKARGVIKRVVLLGPSHRVAFPGLAASNADRYRTPLGEVPIDLQQMARIEALPQVRVLDQAHQLEHSLEVHLPFLQEVLGDFSLIPLVVGDAGPEEVGEVLELLWGGPETLIVVSSDLSHYHGYEAARKLDAATTSAIEHLRYQDLSHEDACGRNPIRGLLWAAGRRGLHLETVDLRNSGDTAGPRDAVVGYGAYVVQ